MHQLLTVGYVAVPAAELSHAAVAVDGAALLPVAVRAAERGLMAAKPAGVLPGVTDTIDQTS